MEKKELVSKAKEIRWLFKKFDKLKKKYDTSNFKEPVAQLIRRNGRVGFFEEATKGRFDFMHSDGTERSIYLDPKWLKTFPYGEKEFRGYILDEDSPTPLPSHPVTTAEQVNIVIEKSMADLHALKAKEIKAKTGMIKMLIIGVAVIAGAIILYKLLIVPQSTPPPEVIKATVDTIKHNVTSQSISII